MAEFLNDSLGLIREPPSGKERHLGGDLDMVAFPRFSGNTAGHESGSRLVFSEGVNQLIGHGWPYSPKEAGEPGWAFYAAAALNDHNPWWPGMPQVTQYLQRFSCVLRWGGPVNDVALLLPTDDAWGQFKAGQGS